MSKKKSLISILLLICITLLAFSGCKNDPADASSPESSQPQESSEAPETPDLSLTEHRLPDRMDADFVDVLNYFVAKADRILHSGEVITTYLPKRIGEPAFTPDFGDAVTWIDESKAQIDTSLLDKSDLQAYYALGENSTDYDDLRYAMTLEMLLAYYDGCFYRVMTSGVRSERYELAPKYSPDEYESPEACYGAAWSELFEENGEEKYNAIIVAADAKAIITPTTSTHLGETLYPKAVELSIKALQENNK